MVLQYCVMTYYERNLPHWHPEGRQIFVTWRLHGSLPRQVIADLQRGELKGGRQFARAERFLDGASFGPLWLKEEPIAQVVEEAILKGARELHYFEVLAYVIMPNHVHLLIEPQTALARITAGIKGATAKQANSFLRRSGEVFWQCESFDHWIRTPVEAERIRRYIEDNPVRAHLVSSADQWPWSSAARK
jgi:putative transposase